MNDLIITYGLSKEQNLILNEAFPDCMVSNVDSAFTDLLAVPAIAVVVDMGKMTINEIQSFIDVFHYDSNTYVSCIGYSNEVRQEELSFLHNKENYDDLRETIAYIAERLQLPIELEVARDRMQSVIEHDTNNIKCDSDVSLRSQIAHIENMCLAYERFSAILENRGGLNLRSRYPYTVNIDSVLFAMMIAHGMMNESDIGDDNIYYVIKIII